MVSRVPALLWIPIGIALLISFEFELGFGRVRAGSVPVPAAKSPVVTDPGGVAVAAMPDSVPFDHSIHAGTYKMSCLFCHVDADKSTTAGLPSVRKCMGCHKFVDKKKLGVRMLATLWEAKKAPRWRRVYRLPDYVYFSHRVHVNARLECARCHGDVPSMKQITKASSLTMGWCLDCHKEKQATQDCLACHK